MRHSSFFFPCLVLHGHFVGHQSFDSLVKGLLNGMLYKYLFMQALKWPVIVSSVCGIRSIPVAYLAAYQRLTS